MIANSVSCSVQYYEEDEVITMEITIRDVSGIRSLSPFEVKEIVFIHEKSSRLSRLGVPFSWNSAKTGENQTSVAV